MPNNNTLQFAKNNKANEFYTQAKDVEAEVSHYKDYFQGKIVYCNCDSEQSAFWRFFKANFVNYGLKGLFATSQSPNGGILLMFNGNEVKKYRLKGDGTFTSQECIKILRRCDIVCTNPPFSSFPLFVKTVVENGKDLLAIGRQTALSNQYIFNLFKQGKLFAGYGFKRDCAYFLNNQYNDYASNKDRHEEGMIRVAGVIWYTTIRTERNSQSLELTKHYTTNEHNYPKYDDYDAINVDNIKDIPDDYYKPIGVPITYLKHFNPEQFELLGLDSDFTKNGRFNLNGEKKFARAVIKRKENPLTQEFNDLLNRMNDIKK